MSIKMFFQIINIYVFNCVKTNKKLKTIYRLHNPFCAEELVPNTLYQPNFKKKINFLDYAKVNSIMFTTILSVQTF